MSHGSEEGEDGDSVDDPESPSPRLAHGAISAPAAKAYTLLRPFKTRFNGCQQPLQKSCHRSTERLQH